MTEIALILVVLGLGLLAMAGMQVQVMTGSEDGIYRRYAVGLAREQLGRVQALPAAARRPGSDYAPASWISFPGREPGVLPVLVDPGRRLQQSYRVSWRVVSAEQGLEAQVRVAWNGRDGRQRELLERRPLSP